MFKKYSVHDDGDLVPIFELKFATDMLYFKIFEKGFKLPPELNFTHMKTLLILNLSGSCTMSEISHKMLLEKGSFTPVAGKLIENGFIRKEQSIEDKRVYKLVMTDSGLKLTNSFKVAHADYIHSVLDNLDDDEKTEYHGLIKELNRINTKLKERVGLE